MLKNYFKIALRNLRKNTVFSFINISGLAIGLACCMLITLYLVYETSYDGYQKNIKNLYQIGTVFINHGQKDKISSNTPAPMADAMKQEFPEVIQSTRLLGLFVEDKTLFQYRNNLGEKQSFYEVKGYLADSSFFKMFTYNFIAGDPVTALIKPNSIVLSEEIANKIFRNQEAINKIIHISSNTNGDHDYTVTGVFRNYNKPSHIDARFFMSMLGGDMESYMSDHAKDFASNNMFKSYLELKPGGDAAKLEAKFPEFMKKYASEDLKKMGFDKKQFLIPVKNIHTYADIDVNVTPTASKTYLYVLASIAIFTLLIACINFMNLSTARSSKRSSEVGIRKVLGAEKKLLIFQFLGESLLMSLIAFVFAVGITFLMLPLFNTLSGKQINFSFADNILLLLAFFGLAIVTGLLAGSYPAFYLSSFKPAKVLKGKFSNSLAAVSLRKGLVVFQFFISIVLIIASIVIAAQMKFMRTADLGFTKDQQIVIPLRTQTSKKIYASLRNEIKNNSQVIAVGSSLYYPGIFNPSDNGFYKAGQTMDDSKRTRLNKVDDNFLQTLNIHPVAGRLFSKDFPADTLDKLILNEAAVKEYGFSSAQKAIGDYIYSDYKGNKNKFEIVGVVKDFHYEDLHLPITPYGFRLLKNDSSANYIMVHAIAGDKSGLLKSIQGSWAKLDPNDPFKYTFLDEDFQKNYISEDRLANIVRDFTLIAILISCLGLFGLATFSAEQRIKEIGVRKVLGANMVNIVSLLSKDFLKLVFIAVIIASPLAWYAMNKWLQNFAYRISINWIVFLITAVIALLIALLTISFQAIKAAIANPIKSLRTE